MFKTLPMIGLNTEKFNLILHKKVILSSHSLP